MVIDIWVDVMGRFRSGVYGGRPSVCAALEPSARLRLLVICLHMVPGVRRKKTPAPFGTGVCSVVVVDYAALVFFVFDSGTMCSSASFISRGVIQSGPALNSSYLRIISLS